MTAAGPGQTGEPVTEHSTAGDLAHLYSLDEEVEEPRPLRSGCRLSPLHAVNPSHPGSCPTQVLVGDTAARSYRVLPVKTVPYTLPAGPHRSRPSPSR